MRSVRRVAQKVNRGSRLGVQAFTAIGYKLLEVTNTEEVSTLFDVLGGRQPVSDALVLMPNSRILKDCSTRHNLKSWEECSHWVEWWTRPVHMLERSCLPVVQQNEQTLRVKQLLTKPDARTDSYRNANHSSQSLDGNSEYKMERHLRKLCTC